MELRKYQEKQLNFLISHDNTKKVVGLESPTGSGKSFVMLSYIKHLFDNHGPKTVVIATGSNNLVFEFADNARKFGLDPIIYVGNNMLTCHTLGGYSFPKKGVSKKGKRWQIFSQDPEQWCSTIKHNTRVYDEETKRYKLSEKCRKCKLHHLKTIKDELKNRSKNHLIITNHLAYLIHAIDSEIYKPDYVLIDEAHMFDKFYQTWSGTEINRSEISFIRNQLKGKPQEQLFNIFLNRGTALPQQLITGINDIIKRNTRENKDLAAYVSKLTSSLSRFSSTESSDDNVFMISENEMVRVNFYTRFEIQQKTIKYRLFTATLDRFTRIMFGMNPDDFELFYRERNLRLIDYTKSDCHILKINNFNQALNQFIDHCVKKEYKSGIILSTTLENVANLKNQGKIGPYTVFTSIGQFREYNGPKVLVGSRALFQGIDVPEVSFVVLNKIPFETYDDLFIKRTNYLKNNAGLDPWNDYTIPLVKNNIIQTTGRLWRHPDDAGSIAIFDPRLDGRFKYLMRSITDTRFGIQVFYEGLDPELSNEEGFDDIIRPVNDTE